MTPPEGEQEPLNRAWPAVPERGRGMTPRIDSPGIGFGLALIAQMTQDFRVEHRAEGGTSVLMRFAL